MLFVASSLNFSLSTTLRSAGSLPPQLFTEGKVEQTEQASMRESRPLRGNQSHSESPRYPCLAERETLDKGNVGSGFFPFRNSL